VWQEQSLDKPTQLEPRNILPDCIIPAMAVCFTIYYLTTITEVPWISQASAVVVSGLLLLSIAAFVVRSVSRIRAGKETIELSFDIPSDIVGINIKRVILFSLTISYVWIIDSWGFTITTFSFIFLSILLLSSLANWQRAFLVALSCSIIGYVVFIYFFKTRFPRGPIENWLKAMLS
jgi:hypothetical protein